MPDDAALMTAELPDRRAHFVEIVKWAGATWLVGVGLDPDGRAIEIFVDPADTEVEVIPAVVHSLHSHAITVSHLLRLGVRAAAHAARLDCQAPDLITLALRRAVEIEASEGAWVRTIEGWRAARLAGRPIDISAELAASAAAWAAEVAGNGPPARVLP